VSALDRHLADYLRLRRALGYKLERAGRVLPQFLAWLDTVGAQTVTVELAIAWARLPEGVQAIQWAHRLGAVRGFARYLATIEPGTEIPPKGVFAARQQRPTPYVYSAAEVGGLLRATRALRPPLRAATHEALFGLLGCSGMRIGEAIGMTRDDVDLGEGVITIRHAKFDRDRIVPLHPSATVALRGYAVRRDGLCSAPKSDRFFLSSVGTALTYSRVRETFAQVSTATGPAHRHPQAQDPRPKTQPGRSHSRRLAARRCRCRVPDGGAVDLPRAREPGRHLLVSERGAGADATGRSAPGRPFRGPVVSAFAPLVQTFFTDRLIGQRRASAHTLTGYRDTFRLLLTFAAARTGKQPCSLDIADLDAPLIGAFLDHLEHNRGNSVRTRNYRLAAIHSLFGYAALRHPEHAATIQQVLAIPTKRCQHNLVSWLTEPEVDALLAGPDRTTWTGRRDHAMLVLTAQTGLRISELTGLTISDVALGAGANVHCVGKGRKERATPLTKLTVRVLRVWLTECGGAPDDPLFPTITGTRLSRDAVEHRLARHLATARDTCPSLRSKHVGMHTLRHSAAMRLLESGTDVTVIALWLGHEQPSTTARIYLHADMTVKERAIARVRPPGTTPGRYQPSDTLLAFLDAL